MAEDLDSDGEEELLIFLALSEETAKYLHSMITDFRETDEKRARN